MPKYDVDGTVIEQAARVLAERVGRTTITDADRSLVRDMLDAAGLLHTDPAAPRVPQPGDRVLGWAGRPFGTVHGFVVADEITNAAGFIAVKAPAVATPYAVDAASVEVIEPAPATEQPSEWTPTVGERVTGRLDGTSTETTGRYVGPGAQPWLSILDVGRTARPQVVTSTLRPADTGKETDR